MDGQASGAGRQPRFRVLAAFATKVGYPFAHVARRADLEAITRLGCLSFGASAFGIDKFRALHRVNPNILWAIKSSDGVIEGYLDIIPLKAAFAEELITGKKRESDLAPSDVLPEEDIRQGCAGYIYLAALVQRNAAERRRGLSPTFCKLVFAGMERVLQITAANPKLSSLLALGYRQDDGGQGPGTPYLIEFGFREMGASKEGYPVYVLTSDRGFGGLESAFSAISVLREKRIHAERQIQKKKILLALAALFLVVVPLSMHKFGMSKEVLIEIGVTLAAATIVELFFAVGKRQDQAPPKSAD